MNALKKFVLPTALLASALVLGACAGSPASTSTPSPVVSAQESNPAMTAEVNASDLMFVEMMIPHHEQAVEMALLAPTHGANPEVLALAAKIASAQGPEIEQMRAMLDRWGVSEMMSHTGHQMDGMVSASGLKDLDEASGAEFDRLFLTYMIGHHEGAIAMAQDPLVNGDDAELNALLKAIVSAQNAEIEQMNMMLQQLQ